MGGDEGVEQTHFPSRSRTYQHRSAFILIEWKPCSPLHQSPSSSTRNRTWNFSLEASGDIRFTIEPSRFRQSVEPMERKARELNPHNCNVALFSKQARQTVSGYLPSFRWSHRNSNEPLPQGKHRSPCHGDVFPLDHDPICDSTQRFVRESNSIFDLTENACCRNTYKPFH